MSHPQRILIAGATGAVGRILTPALVADGHDVHGLARSPQAAQAIAAMGAQPVRADALRRDEVLDAVAAVRPDAIVHQLSSFPRGAASRKAMRRHLAMTARLRREATRHLAEAAERHGTGRLIAQSIAFATRAEGPPVLAEDAPLDTDAPGSWGETVRAVAELEDAVLSGRGFVGVVLRYGGFYGPGTAVAPDGFVGELVRRRRLPVIGGGAGMQSFVHVEDAAGAARAALTAPAGTWNVVDDEPVAAREWIPALARALGAPPPRRVPAWVARLAGGPEAVRAMTVQRGASNTRITRDLGWRPRHATWRAGFLTLAAG